MSENDPPLNPTAIAPPSTDLQPTSAAGSEGAAAAAEWQPELELTERPLVQQPRWPHPNLGWSLLWCLLFMFITQVPGALIALGIIASIAILSPDTLPLRTLGKPAELLASGPVNAALAVAFFITELMVIGFSWLIIRLVVGRDWKRELALRVPSLTHTLLTLAGLPALWLLASIIYDVLRSLIHLPSLGDVGGIGMKEMEQVFSRWPWGFAVLVIGLGPGIGEELWCRGFLGRGLVGNYGVVLGVLFTSFFFGLIHLDPYQGTMAALMGLWLHFLYLTTRSLLLPMLLHFLNNSLSVLAPRLPSLALLDSQPQAVPLTVYLTGLLLLVGVAYALYQSRARLVPRAPDALLAWQPAFPGVEYPPPESGMQVVHPPPSLLAVALSSGGFLLFLLACAAWISRQ